MGLVCQTSDLLSNLALILYLQKFFAEEKILTSWVHSMYSRWVWNETRVVRGQVMSGREWSARNTHAMNKSREVVGHK